MISRSRIIAAAALTALAAPLASQAPAPPVPAPSAPAAPAPSGRIPAETLAELPFIRNPVLSPDGFHLAARLTSQGRTWIGVYDLRLNLGEQRPLVVEQGDYDIIWLRWAGNSRLLFGLRAVRTIPLVEEEVSVTRAGSIDLASDRTTPLIGGNGILGDDIIYVDPNGAYVLLSSQETLTDYPSVDRIDLATGRTSLVQSSREGVWNWFADNAGVVRVGVAYDDRRIQLYYRSGPGQDLRRIASRRPARDGSIIDAVRFPSASDRGIVVTNEVNGRFGVYSYDFASDTLGAPIFEHPEVDVTSVLVGSDGELDGVAYEDDRPRVHWVDPDLQRLQAVIDRTLPDKVNTILGRSTDSNKVLIFSTAADDPGTYFLFDRAAHDMHGFATPYQRLSDHQFAPVRAVHYQSRDGLSIPAYLTLPPGRGERGLPLIVMPHGGPFYRDSWEFDPWVQFLASRGYAVLQPQFRGSTGYGRDYVERGFGQFGSGMIDDLEDGVAWLAGQGTIDRSRVCIMGASYGGYAALWAPIRNPGLYRCAISFAGISDMGAMYRYDLRGFSAERYSREWRRQVQGETRTDLSLISPLQQVARLRVPLLIAHGERDRTVPPSQSHNLVRALTRAGTPVESIFYREEAHGFDKPEDSIDFLRRAEAFLDRYNPADAPASGAPAPAPDASAQPRVSISAANR